MHRITYIYPLRNCIFNYKASFTAEKVGDLATMQSECCKKQGKNIFDSISPSFYSNVLILFSVSYASESNTEYNFEAI